MPVACMKDFHIIILWAVYMMATRHILSINENRGKVNAKTHQNELSNHKIKGELKSCLCFFTAGAKKHRHDFFQVISGRSGLFVKIQYSERVFAAMRGNGAAGGINDYFLELKAFFDLFFDHFENVGLDCGIGYEYAA